MAVTMICFYCKCDMIDSTTTYAEDLGNCVVIIRNVTCSSRLQHRERENYGITEQSKESIISCWISCWILNQKSNFNAKNVFKKTGKQPINTKHRLVCSVLYMAERRGFEPLIRCSPYT